MTNLSQRDPRWKSLKLGSSNTTIGDYGCTITCLAMILGTTPDVVNERLNSVNGFAEGNLVIWAKIEEAFPGIKVKRVWSYNNDDVLKNVPNVLVEVDGKPIGGFRHWVVYIGNKKCIDPWDGKEDPTSDYPDPKSYCVIGGQWKKPSPVTETQSELDKVRQERDRNWNYFTSLCDALGVTHNQEIALAEIHKLVELEDVLRGKDKQLSDAHTEIESLEKQLTELSEVNNTLKEENKKLQEQAKGQHDQITQQGDMITIIKKQLEDVKKNAKLPILTGWKLKIVQLLAHR